MSAQFRGFDGLKCNVDARCEVIERFRCLESCDAGRLGRALP